MPPTFHCLLQKKAHKCCKIDSHPSMTSNQLKLAVLITELSVETVSALVKLGEYLSCESAGGELLFEGKFGVP